MMRKNEGKKAMEEKVEQLGTDVVKKLGINIEESEKDTDEIATLLFCQELLNGLSLSKYDEIIKQL